MKIALVIVHNKTNQENFNQIEAIKPLINKITDTNNEFDDQGNIIGTFNTYHYELVGISVTHEARFFQIIPFGVTSPTNLYDIDSHNVIYRLGDEDKTGDHSRFFNWGMKRATDYGAEVVVYIDDYTQLDFAKIILDIEKLADINDLTELVDAPEVTIGSLKLLKEVGQLDESKSKADAIVDLKQATIDAGLEVKEVVNV